MSREDGSNSGEIFMARMTKARYGAYAEQWRRAGPKLERIHAEELGNIPTIPPMPTRFRTSAPSMEKGRKRNAP